MHGGLGRHDRLRPACRRAARFGSGREAHVAGRDRRHVDRFAIGRAPGDVRRDENIARVADVDRLGQAGDSMAARAQPRRDVAAQLRVRARVQRVIRRIPHLEFGDVCRGIASRRREAHVRQRRIRHRHAQLELMQNMGRRSRRHGRRRHLRNVVSQNDRGLPRQRRHVRRLRIIADAKFVRRPHPVVVFHVRRQPRHRLTRPRGHRPVRIAGHVVRRGAGLQHVDIVEVVAFAGSILDVEPDFGVGGTAGDVVAVGDHGFGQRNVAADLRERGAVGSVVELQHRAVAAPTGRIEQHVGVSAVAGQVHGRRDQHAPDRTGPQLGPALGSCRIHLFPGPPRCAGIAVQSRRDIGAFGRGEADEILPEIGCDTAGHAESGAGADVELISAGAADGGPIGGEVGQPHGAGSENAGAVGEAIGREVQGGTVGRADAVDGIGPVVDLLARRQACQGHGERARTAAGMRHLGVGGRRCTGCIPNDAALRHRLPPLGRHVAGGVGLRGIRRRARRRRGRADRRQRPRRRVGRHARRVVVVVDAVELVIIRRARRPAGVRHGRPAAVVDDHVPADRVVDRIGLARRRSGERTVGAPHHHHVLAVPLRPVQRDSARRRRHRPHRRIRQRADREIAACGKSPARGRFPIHVRVIGAAAIDEAAGIVPISNRRELVLARLGLPLPVRPVVAVVLRGPPGPARSVRRST